MVKQISDNEIYLLIKHIRSVLWRVAKCLSYIEEARCLKVNFAKHGACLRMGLLTDVYRNLTSLWIKPRERAFKQFKSPVLNVLRRIYGPICEGAIWGSRYNEELYRLYDETDLVKSVRITRLRWAGHEVRMQDNLPCKKITLDKPEGRSEWEDQTSDGWMECRGMERGWESEIGGSRPWTVMVGGDFLSRPRPWMGCSAWVDGWMDGFTQN
jgi:hypothetical protein